MSRYHLLAAALGLVLVDGACLVQSQCAADYDCAASERCNLTRSSEGYGSCFVECQSDQDCYIGGAYFGKSCQRNRCEFRFDERVQAPGFCMKAINPKSTSFEKDWCLSSARGKVTVLYFAWLT